MFKQLVNECVIDLHIRPDGPVLIKSGIATVSGPDMAFVTVLRNGDWEVYLPGSSLKGVLRSHAERIARTFTPEAACDPFAKKDDPEPSCSACFDKRKDEGENGLDTPTAYRDSCLICQLFGSTWMAGRLATTDAYAVGEPSQPQRRDGVGIDRFTGGTAYGAKFELEVITEGTFATTLHLRNFELWQLALVGFLLQDLKDGLIRIGMGKSRGLGKARGEVKDVRLDFLGPKAPQIDDGHLPLRGVGSLFDEAEAYGITTPDEISVPFEGELTSNGVRTTAIFPLDSFPWAQIAERWVNRVQGYSMPEAMRRYRGGGRR
ncbi:MAG TPA: CRISPR-associated RAMP protein [Chloroflexi bacterium]|mgnify:CR=1 FL=1|nr:CRISPR-associated RAMP protein [Chloroflexota bacterium]